MSKLVFTYVPLILTCLCELTIAYRILVFFPAPSKSHSILGHGVVDRLLEDGHEVVHVTGFPKHKNISNLKEIDVSKLRELFVNDETKEMFKLKNLIGSKQFNSLTFMLIAQKITLSSFEMENLVEFLSDPQQKFDAVILEWFFTEIIAGIPPLFECPMIWVCSTEAHWQVLRLVDEVSNPSYNVDLTSSNIPPLSMYQRLQELWYLEIKQIMYKLWIVPVEWYHYHSIFTPLAEKRGVKMPGYEEAVYNGSFLFINSHPSYGSSFRLPQNAKYIGGYHISDLTPSLPEKLQKIMDDSKHGVIYFSLGSNLNSSDMSDEMKRSLFEMFGKLKETVIWKFEEDAKIMPKNVFLVKWAPQQSILAHPNIKLFITHGGKLSTTEAVHFSVPVIGIPVIGDQFVNMNSVVHKGFGITVDFNDKVASNLDIALKEMLHNQTYKDKVRELSMIYHDRVTSPGAELRHWVRHVVRTRGAAHLRSPALPLTTYTKVYLDVVAIIVIVVFICYIVAKKVGLKRDGKIKQQ